MQNFGALILTLTLVFAPRPALADPVADKEKDQILVTEPAPTVSIVPYGPCPLFGPPPPPRTIEQKILAVADTIAKGVDNTADYLDLTLAGQRYTDKPNTSSLDVSQMVSYIDGGEFRKSTDFGLNIKLPNVEKRWQLRFTSYDEESEERDLTQQRLRTRPRTKDYGAGVFFFQKIGKLKTLFQPRLQLKNPLEMSYILRFESDVEAVHFKIHPRLEFYADPKKGAGEFFELDTNRQLSARWGLDFSNTEEYRSADNLFSTQHELSLGYSLTKTQGLGTAFTLACQNKGHFHVHGLTYSLAYGMQIYPQRLKFGTSPFIVFEKNNRFKGRTGISLTVDVLF